MERLNFLATTLAQLYTYDAQNNTVSFTLRIWFATCVSSFFVILWAVPIAKVISSFLL